MSPRVIALLPAHNEEVGIGAAVASLRAQTRAPDVIIVVADNCTDRTEEIAAAAGATVMKTVGNTHKKAGALNQALDAVLPMLADHDVVLVQDADSMLDPQFIEAGLAAYGPGIGGVGGVFRGRIDAPTRWGRFVQWLQTNEYARYELDIRRQRGRVLVLTGTATLLRASIIREVIEARRTGRLPGGKAQFYDTKVLTEDNEASFALLHLGYRIKSPKPCTLTTETMPTWRTLANQRLRWKRGAIENLFDYGWTKATRAYWLRQATGVLGVVITAAYLGTLLLGVIVGFSLHPFWLGITAIFAAERMVTVRRRGPVAMAVAALLVVEMVFDLFLQFVQARAYAQAALGIERRW